MPIWVSRNLQTDDLDQGHSEDLDQGHGEDLDQGHGEGQSQGQMLEIGYLHIVSSDRIVFKLGRYVCVSMGPQTLKRDVLGQGQVAKGQGQILNISYLCL